MQEKRYLT